MTPSPTTDPWAEVGPSHPVATSPVRRAVPPAVAVLVGGAATVRVAFTEHGALPALLLAAAALAVAALLGTRSTDRPLLSPAGTVTAGLAVGSAAVVGAAATAFTVAAVALAHGAMRGRPPWRDGGQPRGATATRGDAVDVDVSGDGPAAALTLALVVLGSLTWWRGGPTVASFASLAAAGAAIEARSRSTALRRLDDAVRRGFAVLGTVAANLVVGVVAIPLLYVPAAVTAPLRWWRRTPRWHPLEVTDAELRRDARRPFATVPRATRLRRAVAGACGVALLLVAAWVVRDRTAGTAPEDGFSRAGAVPLSELEAFEDVPFADELKAEQDRFANYHVRFDPDTWFSYSDFSGRFTNVVDGERLTPAAAACADCHHATVWLLGGSAAFGLAQRDQHTIAAELVRGAGTAGVSLEVVNLGMPGWTAWQELRAVRARLEAGHEPPDLVVFYDGFNDVVGAITESAKGTMEEGRPNLLLTWEAIAAEEQRYTLAADRAELVADTAARRYLEVVDEADGVLGPLGIEAHWVLQPDAFASQRQLDAVRPVLSAHLLGDLDPTVLAVDRFEALVEPHVQNLRPLARDHPEALFADLVHMNEPGAALVARALLPEMLGRVGAP